MQIGRGDADTVQSTRFGYYDAIANNTDIVGVVVPFRWNMLEGAQGDYSAGIAALQAEIQYLKNLAVPKRLYLRIIDMGYNQAASSIFPTYVLNSGATISTPTSSIWRKWNSTYMDWYINMVTAYAAAFDNEPFFEGFYLIRETALNWGGATPPPDYNVGDYDTQLRRLALAAKTAWTKTSVVMPANFMGGQSVMDAHVAYLASIAAGVGGPDVLPPPHAGTHMYNTLTGASGGHDYRGEIPVQCSIEASELGGSIGSWTPAELFAFANDTLRTSHLFWQRNYHAGTAEQQWPAIMTFIASNPLTHTNPPTVYNMLPAAPSGLGATAVSSSQVDLTWTDNATNETEFRIERKTGAGAFGLLTTKATNSTAHSDTTVAAGTAYTYRVRAENLSGVSSWSNEAAATTGGGGGGGSPMTVQFESSTVAAHTDPYQVRSTPADVLFQSDADGDAITFSVPNVSAGTYAIAVMIQTGPNRGIFQLESSASLSGPYTTHGSPQDTYASSWNPGQVLAIASGATFGSTGTRYFRFRITGKNGASNDRYLAVDEMTLTPGGTTTSYLSLAAEDGWVLESGETTNVGGSVNATDSGASALRVGDDASRRQYRSILSFNTADLPDGATLLSATLRLKRGTQSGSVGTLGTLRADMRTYNFNSNVALESADFAAPATATQVATLSIPTSNGQWSTGELDGAGLAAINKVGRTQFRIYFSTDDDNDSTADYMGFYSGANATESNRPVLEIIYQ